MKMTFVIVCCFLADLSYAQGKITFFDEDGKSVKEKNATVLQEQVKLNDTLWEFNNYLVNGPLYISMQTRDEKGTLLNGRYLHYDRKGNCDSMGSYSNGHKAGNWDVYTPKGSFLKQLTYSNGVLTGKTDSTQWNEAIKKQHDSLLAGRTTMLIEIESEFEGGPAGWLEYLKHHMTYPDRAINREVQGTAIVGFQIDADGRIDPSTIYMQHSVEYSIDQVSKKLIRESPDWRPAVQDDKKVRSYKKQPVVFKLTRG